MHLTTKMKFVLSAYFLYLHLYITTNEKEKINNNKNKRECYSSCLSLPSTLSRSL